MDQPQIQAFLKELVGSGVHVYFQPPANVQMVYPCIMYQRDYAVTQFADNKPYSRKKRYQVTIIDEDPNSELPELIANLPLSSYDRFFAVGDLNHDIYNVYF